MWLQNLLLRLLSSSSTRMAVQQYCILLRIIKDELIKNGPVVSTSFCPSPAFIRDNSIQQRDILIVGWKQLPSGEAWIVQPLCKEGSRVSKVVCVAIGQYGIDDRCLAPRNSFDNKPWQSGPYYDTSMRGVENV